MSSSLQVHTIECPRNILGEGPHWDIPTQSLYFVDICKPELPLYRYDYGEKKTYAAKLTGCDGQPHVSVIIPIHGEPNHFAVTMDRKVGVIEWNGKSTEAKLIRTVASVEEEPEFSKQRINDTKADPTGRLYFGTMGHEPNNWGKNTGSLYKYKTGEQVTKLFDGVNISNGLAWHLGRKKFYYNDSLKFNIMEFDYNAETGDISNGQVLIDFRVNGKDPSCFLDGMTIDRDGFLYAAMFNGHKVVKVDPTNGTVVMEIPIPAQQVTSVAFGGPNLDILYVTTAAWEFDSAQPDPAGKVFSVTGPGIGVGLSMENVRI